MCLSLHMRAVRVLGLYVRILLGLYLIVYTVQYVPWFSTGNADVYSGHAAFEKIPTIRH